MTPPFSKVISLSAPEQTDRFAAAIARCLEGGDCLLLSGPVGAGKSFFARSVITALLARDGRQEDIPSPTFTLVQTYETAMFEIWHADLYRLQTSAEVIELGLFDAIDHTVTLIEWPDRLGADAPRNALSLTLAFGETEQSRHLTCTYSDPKWSTVLSEAVAGLPVA